MSKVQVLFSVKDQSGLESTVSENINNHFMKNAAGVERRVKSEVPDDVIKSMRPRGKAYINMWLTQTEKQFM